MMRSLTAPARKARIAIVCLIVAACGFSIHLAVADPPRASSDGDADSFSERLRLADARLATAAMIANYAFQDTGRASKVVAATSVREELQQLLEELQKAKSEAMNASATKEESERAVAKLHDILARLIALRAKLLQGSTGVTETTTVSDCRPCQTIVPSPNCPKNVPCRKKDQCVYIYLPPIYQSEPVFSAEGVFAVNSIINNGVARGFENVMVRAANATKVCPDTRECETIPCPPQTPTPATNQGQGAATGGSTPQSGSGGATPGTAAPTAGQATSGAGGTAPKK